MHLKHTFNVTVFFISIGILLSESVNAQPSFPEYDGMVVFGNSLSDNGNAHQMICEREPCGPDLFTNGKNMVESLAELLRFPKPAYDVSPAKNYLITDTQGFSFNIFQPEGTNFAIGGTVVPVERQVGRYLASVGNQASDQSLYVFFLGGNWVNYSLNEEIEGKPCSEEDPYVCPGRNAGMNRLAAYAQSLRESMELLIREGAQHFLVINADSFSTTPNGRTYLYDYLNELNAYAFEYNHFLHSHVSALADQYSIQVQEFDLYTVVEEIKEQPEIVNITNVEDACGIYNMSTRSFDYSEPCNASNVNSYIYYDGVHWTQGMGQAVAGAIVLDTIELGPVRPELVSHSVEQVSGNINFSIEASADVVDAKIQFPYEEFSSIKTGELQWSLQLNDLEPGRYPYSVVLENSESFKKRSYGDVIYVCEEKTLDQFVASGQVNFNPGSRWFWFSTPGEYVIASTGFKVGDEGDGNELLRMMPFFGVWEQCPPG